MIRITLPGGIDTFIDDADQLLVAGFSWRPLVQRDHTYVHASRGNLHLYMHRLIAGAGPEDQVDHRDGNGLNNVRLNLRIAKPSQNLANRGKPRFQRQLTSRFKGVSWDKSRERWIVFIKMEDRHRMLGRFLDEEDAARAYDRAALESWGRFARLNFPAEKVTVCGMHDLGIPDAPCTC